MRKDPAIPIAAAFIVFLKPSQSCSRLSQMKDHSNDARILIGLCRYERPLEARPLVPSFCL